MPRLDRTGPSGAGPRTGGGRGRCNGQQSSATGDRGSGNQGLTPMHLTGGRRQRRRIRRCARGFGWATPSAWDDSIDAPMDPRPDTNTAPPD